MWCLTLLFAIDNLTSIRLSNHSHSRGHRAELRTGNLMGVLGCGGDVMVMYEEDYIYEHSGPWKETGSSNAEKEKEQQKE